MQETKQERCLQNYENYLKRWNKYELDVREHFRNKDILKYGSERQAQLAQAKKTLETLQYSNHPTIVADMIRQPGEDKKNPSV